MAKNLTAVAFLAMDESDKEFGYTDPKGRKPRYMVVQLDGDCFFFADQHEAEHFIHVHGLLPVCDAEWKQLIAEHEGGEAANDL